MAGDGSPSQSFRGLKGVGSFSHSNSSERCAAKFLLTSPSLLFGNHTVAKPLNAIIHLREDL